MKSFRLAGMSVRMSFANDRTSELWRRFRGFRSGISGLARAPMYSVQIYKQLPDFRNLSPEEPFVKWAAVEEILIGPWADSLEYVTLPAGKYAVFKHHGPAAAAPDLFRYIFGEWLPASGYQLDNRPHFEILPPDYDAFDPEAEEEVCIPVCVPAEGKGSL